MSIYIFVYVHPEHSDKIKYKKNIWKIPPERNPEYDYWSFGMNEHSCNDSSMIHISKKRFHTQLQTLSQEKIV